MSAASTPGKKANGNIAKKSSTNANGRNDDKSSSKTSSATRQDGAAVEELTAAPRVGCIEVRKMRLRIQLFQQHKAWNPNNNTANYDETPKRYNTSNNNANNATTSTNSEEGMDNAKVGEAALSNSIHESSSSSSSDDFIPDSDGWNNNALLVRRRNTILISTRRGVGAVMLRFKSTHDCMEFCDRLVYLNREILLGSADVHVRDDAKIIGSIGTTTTDGEKGNYEGVEYVNGLDKREYQQEENVSFKRRKISLYGDQKVDAPYYDDGNKQKKYKITQGGNNDNTVEPSSCTALLSQEVKQYQRQEEVMNYIVRLAHSEEFRGFVDELERGLETMMMGSEEEDTSAIPHAALGF